MNNTIPHNSWLMNLLMLMGLKKLAWSCRRLYCPVASTALVLEVGSGGNPFPRSNVLLDAHYETSERHWVDLVHDRPTVLAFAEDLPFKDNAFDFVIAAHVLEHSSNPVKFLAELQRVAKSGYIETPDAFMERINPYTDHRLEITVRQNRLLITKKNSWIKDVDLVELYENRVKKIITKDTIPNNPNEFHVRYFWKKNIDYKITNPDVNADWLPNQTQSGICINNTGYIFKIKSKLLGFIRFLFSQSFRNIKLDILPLMRCTHCQHDKLFRKSSNEIACHECNSHFKIDNNIFHLH